MDAGGKSPEKRIVIQVFGGRQHPTPSIIPFDWSRGQPFRDATTKGVLVQAGRNIEKGEMFSNDELFREGAGLFEELPKSEFSKEC